MSAVFFLTFKVSSFQYFSHLYRDFEYGKTKPQPLGREMGISGETSATLTLQNSALGIEETFQKHAATFYWKICVARTATDTNGYGSPIIHETGVLSNLGLATLHGEKGSADLQLGQETFSWILHSLERSQEATFKCSAEEFQPGYYRVHELNLHTSGNNR